MRNRQTQGRHRRAIGWVAGWLLAVATLQQAAIALELGDVEVQSNYGEPLLAVIPITALISGERDSLQVTVGSAAAYQLAGRERSAYLDSIRIDLVERDGQPLLRLRSDQSLRQPFLPVFIDAQWRGNRLLREYTLMPRVPDPAADPARAFAPGGPRPTSPAPAASAANATAVSAPPPTPAWAEAPTRAASAAPAPAVPAAAAHSVTPSSATASVAAPRVARPPVNRPGMPEFFTTDEERQSATAAPSRIASSGTSRRAMAPAPARGSAEALDPELLAELGRDNRQPYRTSGRVVDGYYTVVRGETLWRVALNSRPDNGVSMDQMQLAIARANPDAFHDGDLRRLRSQVRLRIPDRARIVATDAARARIELQALLDGGLDGASPASGGTLPASRTPRETRQPLDVDRGHEARRAAERVPASSPPADAPSVAARSATPARSTAPPSNPSATGPDMTETRPALDPVVAERRRERHGDDGWNINRSSFRDDQDSRAPARSTPRGAYAASPLGWAWWQVIGVGIVLLILFWMVLRRLLRMLRQRRAAADKAPRAMAVAREADAEIDGDADAAGPDEAGGVADKAAAHVPPAPMEPALIERPEPPPVDGRPSAQRDEPRPAAVAAAVAAAATAAAAVAAGRRADESDEADIETDAAEAPETADDGRHDDAQVALSVATRDARGGHDEAPAMPDTAAAEPDAVESTDAASIELPPVAPLPMGGEGNEADALAQDLSGFDLDPPPLIENDAPGVELPMPEDIDLGGFDAVDELTVVADGDEAATRLDLAHAYIGMGDHDMARALLREVLEQGDDNQRNEARTLLDGLG